MRNETLISFHGKQEIKDKYIARVKQHHAADEIIKGQYWENGKGCAVGCTLHSGRHDSYDTELGITWRLALLEDSLFENLPNDQAKEFPLQFLNSMPVGVDTNLIFKKFIIWNLSDKKEGLIYHIKDAKEKDLLKRVANAYKKSLTKEISQATWRKLADEAEKLYAYAYAYASASAYAYAYASAYKSPEWQAKFNERIIRMKDKLIELMVAASNEEAGRVDIRKDLAVLPISETSDLRSVPTKPVHVL